MNSTDEKAGSGIVLVVEDDEVLREQVIDTLRGAGYQARAAASRDDLFDEISKGRCLAIVLDIGLPDDDGMSIAAAVRASSSVPILMLTGRVGIESRVAGLEAGADDYLVKPHAPQELVARLRAILRRAGPTLSRERASGVLVIGGARLDLTSGTLQGDGDSTRLTSHEMRLVAVLTRSAGVLSRESAYREVFGRDWDPADRSLDVHVANLRRKLESVGITPGAIATVRGQGYELRVPVGRE